VCVGHRFPGIQWRVIAIDDGPLTDIAETSPVETGQMGELMVRGGVVTSTYVVREDCNALHKVADGQTIWHRMGDVGYLDSQDRFWFCGRKAHRVRTEHGTLYTIPCEAVFNQLEPIYRSALVGVGPVGRQKPVIVVEPWPEHRPTSSAAREAILKQVAERAQACELTRHISHFLIHLSMPVDIRHNSKIFREKLAVWAARKVKK
jgi:acyl-CoA synthetase (AMP-forming)/AMP-acid ligase II